MALKSAADIAQPVHASSKMSYIDIDDMEGWVMAEAIAKHTKRSPR
jgi:hypothetical protein